MGTSKKLFLMLAILCTTVEFSYATSCNSSNQNLVKDVKNSIRKVSSIVKHEKSQRCSGDSELNSLHLRTSSGVQKVSIEYCNDTEEHYVNFADLGSSTICAFPQYYNNQPDSTPAFTYTLNEAKTRRLLQVEERFCSHTNKDGFLKIRSQQDGVGAVILIEGKDVPAYIECLEELKKPYNKKRSQVTCGMFSLGANFSRYLFD